MRWRRIFKGLLRDGGREDFSKKNRSASLKKTYGMSLIHLAALPDSTFKAQAKDVLWNFIMYVFLNTDNHATSPAFYFANYLL
jgi:hypothetical protein